MYSACLTAIGEEDVCMQVCAWGVRGSRRGACASAGRGREGVYKCRGACAVSPHLPLLPCPHYFLFTFSPSSSTPALAPTSFPSAHPHFTPFVSYPPHLPPHSQPCSHLCSSLLCAPCIRSSTTGTLQRSSLSPLWGRACRWGRAVINNRAQQRLKLEGQADRLQVANAVIGG